jgi:ABC-type multidrug transport system fused ATPase/permease subunit
VDRATDAVIQQALRDYTREDPASGRVLLVIAHRIDTIMDCDHLLVMSNGQLLEQGSPQDLACKTDGLFAAMRNAVAK